MQSLSDNYDVHTLRWATTKPPKVYVDGSKDEEIAADEEDDDNDNIEASDGKREGQTITLPTHFTTRSRCCILTNTIDRLLGMGALLDRAYIVEFDPPVGDVLGSGTAFCRSQSLAVGQTARAAPAQASASATLFKLARTSRLGFRGSRYFEVATLTPGRSWGRTWRSVFR